MNRNIKNSVAAAVVLMAMAPAAHAGGVQIDDNSLTDILVAKGVLTKDEAKAVAKNNNGKLKLEAELYLNTYAQKADTTSAGTTTSTKTNGTNVDRVYFTAKYNIDSDWMFRITTDMGHESTLGKKQSIYLKYAYLEGKLAGDAAVLRLGQSHTPWIDHEEGLWGHRYVAKTFIDQYGLDSSSDLGIGLKGKLADGMVNYWVTETNGTGYGNGATSKGLDFDSRLGLNLLEGLTLDFQYRTGKKGTNTYVANVTTSGIKSTLTQAMITYGSGSDWRVGANYVNNEDTAVSATAGSSHGGNVSSGYAVAAINDKLKTNGFDVWGRAKIPGTDFGGFGKYENLTNALTTGGVAGTKEKIHRYVLGAEYFATKGVKFSLVYDTTKLTARGGVAGAERKDTRYGLYSDVKF